MVPAKQSPSLADLVAEVSTISSAAPLAHRQCSYVRAHVGFTAHLRDCCELSHEATDVHHYWSPREGVAHFFPVSRQTAMNGDDLLKNWLPRRDYDWQRSPMSPDKRFHRLGNSHIAEQPSPAPEIKHFPYLQPPSSEMTQRIREFEAELRNLMIRHIHEACGLSIRVDEPDEPLTLDHLLEGIYRVRERGFLRDAIAIIFSRDSANELNIPEDTAIGQLFGVEFHVSKSLKGEACYIIQKREE